MKKLTRFLNLPLNYIGNRKELQTKNKTILAFTLPTAVTFTGLHYLKISLYGFELLSSILPFQLKGKVY